MSLSLIECTTFADNQIVVWDNVYGFDYSCIKEIALREPLVDTVELKAVVSDPCLIKVRTLAICIYPHGSTSPPQHIDLRTVKKEDLSFTAPFTLKATRNDCMYLRDEARVDSR